MKCPHHQPSHEPYRHEAIVAQRPTTYSRIVGARMDWTCLASPSRRTVFVDRRYSERMARRRTDEREGPGRGVMAFSLMPDGAGGDSHSSWGSRSSSQGRSRARRTWWEWDVFFHAHVFFFLRGKRGEGALGPEKGGGRGGAACISRDMCEREVARGCWAMGRSMRRGDGEGMWVDRSPHQLPRAEVS